MSHPNPSSTSTLILAIPANPIALPETVESWKSSMLKMEQPRFLAIESGRMLHSAPVSNIERQECFPMGPISLTRNLGVDTTYSSATSFVYVKDKGFLSIRISSLDVFVLGIATKLGKATVKSSKSLVPAIIAKVIPSAISRRSRYG